MKLFKYLLIGLATLGLVACNDSGSDSQVTKRWFRLFGQIFQPDKWRLAM